MGDTRFNRIVYVITFKYDKATFTIKQRGVKCIRFNNKNDSYWTTSPQHKLRTKHLQTVWTSTNDKKMTAPNEWKFNSTSSVKTAKLVRTKWLNAKWKIKNQFKRGTKSPMRQKKQNVNMWYVMLLVISLDLPISWNCYS